MITSYRDGWFIDALSYVCDYVKTASLKRITTDNVTFQWVLLLKQIFYRWGISSVEKVNEIMHLY